MYRRGAGQKSTGIRTGVLRALLVLAATATVPACGDSNGGAGRPDVQIQPVAPMKFSFHNATGAAVYVDWSARKARLRILRDDVDVLVDPGCSPLCKVACGCLACPAPERKVLKIGPNDKLEVTWEAVHFLLHTCEPPASCACAEPWPVTAGKYRVQLDGSTKVLGGVADPTDPRVLADAELDALAPKCTAGATFELVGASQVTIPIECQ